MLMPCSPMSVKSDNPSRPGEGSCRKMTSRSAPFGSGRASPGYRIGTRGAATLPRDGNCADQLANYLAHDPPALVKLRQDQPIPVVPRKLRIRLRLRCIHISSCIRSRADALANLPSRARWFGSPRPQVCCRQGDVQPVLST